MTSITVTEQRLREMAKRQQAFFAEKSITQNGKKIGLNQCLQATSQGLFGVAFEEAKVLLAAQQVPTAPVGVHLLRYGSETLLMDQGNYLTACCPGSDMEVPFSTLSAIADTLASRAGCNVTPVSLPEVLCDDWETDDIIALATRLHIFEHAAPLYTQIYDSKATFFINGLHAPYAPDGDPEFDWDEDSEIEDNVWDTVIWSPECRSAHRQHEYYITLRHIEMATMVSGDPQHWMIPYAGGTLLLRITY